MVVDAQDGSAQDALGDLPLQQPHGFGGDLDAGGAHRGESLDHLDLHPSAFLAGGVGALLVRSQRDRVG